MAIVPFHTLMPIEAQHLGTNIADAVRLDLEALAQDRSIASLGESVGWYPTLGDRSTHQPASPAVVAVQQLPRLSASLVLQPRRRLSP